MAKGAQLGKDFFADPNEGPTHPLALKRTFGSTAPIRVKLYRDHAAWCPYCHKVRYRRGEAGKLTPQMLTAINPALVEGFL
jgi:glutathione S-transferase